MAGFSVTKASELDALLKKNKKDREQELDALWASQSKSISQITSVPQSVTFTTAEKRAIITAFSQHGHSTFVSLTAMDWLLFGLGIGSVFIKKLKHLGWIQLNESQSIYFHGRSSNTIIDVMRSVYGDPAISPRTALKRDNLKAAVLSNTLYPNCCRHSYGEITHKEVCKWLNVKNRDT